MKPKSAQKARRNIPSPRGAGPTAGSLAGPPLLWLALVAVCAMFARPPAQAASEPPRRMRIHLPPSSAAESRLDAAERQIEKQRWDLALPLLQGIIQDEKQAPVWTGDAYEPAALVANRMLARLPPEARQTYALLYDAEAARLLREGVRRRSESILARAANEYMNTPSGVRATGASADLLMDDGRFHQALRALSALDGRTLTAEQARHLLARRITCLAHVGDAADARVAVQAARERGVKQVRAAGESMPAAEFLERLIRRHTADASGGPARGSFAPDLSYSTSFDLPTVERRAAATAMTGHTLFVNSEAGLTAIDVRGLRTRWTTWLHPAMRRVAALLRGAGIAEEGPLWLPVGDLDFWHSTVNQGTDTISAADGRLLVVDVDFGALALPEEPWNARPDEVLLPNTLQCLDAAGGRLLWRAGGRDGPTLPGFWFATAPAISADRCYVLGIRTGVLWALCLNLADGQEVWRSRIGPIESRQETQRYIMEFYLADACPPVVTRGIAVFPTGQGAVAAFDARDGRPRWLLPYQRSERSIPRLGQTLSVPWSGWRISRPVVAGDSILLTPLDSRAVLCIDADEGALRWSARVDGGLALLGRRAGRVLAQRDSGLTCLDLSNGETVWETTTRDAPVGLGTIGDALSYVPYPDGLHTRELDTGRPHRTLAWPSWIGPRGDLVMLDGALAMVSRDRLTLCVDPGAVPTTDMQPARRRFLDAVREFLHGRTKTAAQQLQSLLDESGPVREQAAVLLAETALELGRADLLEHALRNTPRQRDLRAALAETRVRFSVRHARPAGAAGAYLRVVRNRAMDPAPAAVGSVSLWMRLRSAVEAECARDPAMRDELENAFLEHIRSAAREGNEDVLAAAARHAPFGTARNHATLALGRLWMASGRRDAARRAFTELALQQHDCEVARAAAEELEKLRAPVATPAPRPSECAPPSAEIIWSAPGRLVLPAWDNGQHSNVLLVDREHLRQVDASDGRELWATALPPVPGISAPVRVPERPRQLVGPGYPVYCRIGDRLTVGLPGNLLGIRSSDGKLLWTLPAGRPWAHYAANTRVRKEDLVKRAARGLPLPGAEHPVRRVRLDDFLCGPIAACRIEAGRSVSVVDTVSAEQLLRIEAGQPEELTGVLAAMDAGRLWLALAAERQLLLFDLKDGRLTARWSFPASLPLRGLTVSGSGRAVLADADTVYTFELFGTPAIAAMAVPKGIERLLCADDRLVVVESLDGGTQCLPGPDGGPRFHLPPGDEGRTVWAGRHGDTLLLLQVTGFQHFMPDGRRLQFRCGSWLLRAVRLADGVELWKHRTGVEGDLVVGPPLACGERFLMPYRTEDQVVLLGLDAADGHERCRTELAAAGPLGPVPLLMAPERVIVGLAGEAVALITREPSEDGR